MSTYTDTGRRQPPTAFGSMCAPVPTGVWQDQNSLVTEGLDLASNRCRSGMTIRVNNGSSLSCQAYVVGIWKSFTIWYLLGV